MNEASWRPICLVSIALAKTPDEVKVTRPKKILGRVIMILKTLHESERVGDSGFLYVLSFPSTWSSN